MAIGTVPNLKKPNEKKYGKPQNVLDGESLVMRADEDMSGWGRTTVKRPYLETSSINSGSGIPRM